MNLVEIPLSDLLAVAPFRADRDIRYYLDGVYAEPHPEGGAVLVATNGHVMAMILSHNAIVQQPCIVKWTKGLDAAARKGQKNSPDARLQIETERGNSRIMAPGETYIEPGSATIDGRYPEWRKVIPQNLAPGLPGCLQSKYLDLIMGVKYPGVVTRKAGVSFFHDTKPGDYHVVVARYEGIPDMAVVLMPMKPSQPPVGLPEWLTSKPDVQEKAA
jgi:DNA polymerase III beta subunit, central domain